MKIRIVLIAGIILVLAGIGWYAARTRSSRSPELRLYGNVDIREVTLGFRVSGKLKEVLRDEGDEVKPGEVLATLDDEPYRREFDEAKAQAQSLRARVQLLEAGNRPQEIAQAQAVAHEREVTAANAERQYQRQQELLQSKAVSVQERDDAEARYRETQARLSSAREQLKLLEAGFRAEDIAQGKAEMARAEAAVATAELRQQDTVLKAPSAGVILTRAQEPGAILQAGTPVMTVSLKQPVWVRAYVPESELGRVHSGMKVSILTDSRPGRPYAGQVGYISPRAEFTPKNVETPELRTSLVYRLRIVVTDADEGLRQGMPVTVRGRET